MLKKYQIFLLLVAAIGFLLLLIRFGSNDTRTIGDFSAAYQKYDQAISDEANSVLTNSANSAAKDQESDAALADLKKQASRRISSLSKNDAQLMKVMAEILDLSTKELSALRAYRQAAGDQSADMITLMNQFRDLNGQRQIAYTRFLELSA